MSAWWKIGIFAFYTVAVFGATWHLHSVFDQAKLAKEYQDNLEEMQMKQQEANDHAADLEKENASLRTQQNTAHQKEAYYAPSAHNCPLAPDRLQVLAAAIGGHPAR